MDRKRFIASLGALAGGAALYPLFGKTDSEITIPEGPIPALNLRMVSRVMPGGPPRARAEVRLAIENMRKTGTSETIQSVAMQAYIESIQRGDGLHAIEVHLALSVFFPEHSWLVRPRTADRSKESNSLHIWFDPYKLECGKAYFAIGSTTMQTERGVEMWRKNCERCIYWTHYGESWEDGAKVAAVTEPVFLGEEGFIDHMEER